MYFIFVFNLILIFFLRHQDLVNTLLVWLLIQAWLIDWLNYWLVGSILSVCAVTTRMKRSDLTRVSSNIIQLLACEPLMLKIQHESLWKVLRYLIRSRTYVVSEFAECLAYQNLVSWSGTNSFLKRCPVERR